MPDRREFTPRKRSPEHLRDANLIVIATEGMQTEKKYFEDLSSPTWYHNSRVYVKVIDRIQTGSDPKRVLEMLDGFRREFNLRAYDELWLVVDVDRWQEQMLAEVARLCTQKRYRIAVSNPCFEIWLLFHVRSLEEYSEPERAEFRTNWKDGTNRTRLERELVTILGKYNKSAPDPNDFLPNVSVAIDRARAADIRPEDRWPNDLDSRVYLLAERMIRK
jgi:hypothetical protein